MSSLDSGPARSRPVPDVFASGIEQVYRLRLASGREVMASRRPPVAYARRLGRARPAGRRRPPGHPAAYPGPIGSGLAGPAPARLAARLIGDDYVIRERPVHYTSRVANLAFVEAAAAARARSPAAGRRADLVAQLSPRTTPLHARPRQPAARLVRGSASRPRSIESACRRHYIGEPVPDRQSSCATCGPRTARDRGRPDDRAKVYYAASSRTLVDDVTVLLSRFGIVLASVR